MIKQLDILVACEESQEVTKAFRRLGHNAFSCDLQPCSGGHPEWHIQMDILYHLQQVKAGYYDMVLSFQPCTDLAVSGARWFEKKRLSGEQEESIRFFLNVWKESNCSENPIGIMNGGEYIKKWFPGLYQYAKFIGFPFKPTQIIQPWQFGHGETKATCLWLRGLPKLKPTNIVTGREQKVWKMPPSADRGKLRSKTYSGIAEAIAGQYSEYILNQQLKLAI
jgi:hypothetical protein